MPLYHVSCKEYHVNQVIKAEDFETTEYYNNAVNDNKSWIDDFLDENKPENAPDRKKALYAFDSIANCGAFKNSCKCEIFYYEVEMVEPAACPMCLTDGLIQGDEILNNRLAEEYWNPMEDWKYLEYLSSEMRIIRKVNKPTFYEKPLGLENYLADKALMKTLES